MRNPDQAFIQGARMLASWWTVLLVVPVVVVPLVVAALPDPIRNVSITVLPNPVRDGRLAFTVAFDKVRDCPGVVYQTLISPNEEKYEISGDIFTSRKDVGSRVVVVRAFSLPPDVLGQPGVWAYNSSIRFRCLPLWEDHVELPLTTFIVDASSHTPA